MSVFQHLTHVVRGGQSSLATLHGPPLGFWQQSCRTNSISSLHDTSVGFVVPRLLLDYRDSKRRDRLHLTSITEPSTTDNNSAGIFPIDIGLHLLNRKFRQIMDICKEWCGDDH